MGRSSHQRSRAACRLRCAALSATVVLSGCAAGDAPRQARLEAAEGTAENAHARADHEWMRLHDPRTGTIPRGIGLRENEFAARITASTAAAGLRPLARNWGARGPVNIGGRTKALAIDVADENVILAGGVTSGMWRSDDGGASWHKTTRADQLHSVSCIAQSTAGGAQRTWYYGTGEYGSAMGSSASGPMGSGAVYRGDGVFKSVDGGESWSLLPSTASLTPTVADAFDFVWGLATFGTDGVYAATSTGLWKSGDGGSSWAHVLDPGSAYPGTEVAVGPSGAAWSTIAGDGPAAGIYRSINGGTWQKLPSPPGWPEKTLRTVIGLVPTNPDKVFFWTAEDDPDQLRTHLYRYVEGSGWTDLRPNLPWGGDFTTFGGGMLVLKVKPDDENTLFLGAMNVLRTTNGGQSFTMLDDIETWGRFHVDQHAFAFYPSNPRRMIVGNDGGLFRTEDNLTSLGAYHQVAWHPLNNGYLTTQFYSVAIDHGTPGSPMVAGGMQDNGCMFTASARPTDPWVPLLAWGDGGYVGITNGGHYIYTSVSASLGVMRQEYVNGELQSTEVTPAQGQMGLWMNPMILDAHDQRIMYLPAGRDLWRNSDLTKIPYIWPAQRTTMNWTKLTNVTQLISALAMSESLPRTLYYGSYEGGLYRLDNPHLGQPTPAKLPSAGLPGAAYVQCIAVDPRDVNTLLVVFANYGVISIFASNDGGQHWAPVAGNLEEHPDGSGSGPSVRWVAILYVDNAPVYFAGTSVGLFSTTGLNAMSTVWVKEGGTAIGNVVVDMVDVRQSDGYVAVGTHGNGVFTAYVTGPLERPTRRHLRSVR